MTMPDTHISRAVVFDEPRHLCVRRLPLDIPGADDVVVETAASGISTGTERLLFEGRMPMFPGLGYPLVPGYESVGRVVAGGDDSGLSPGDAVFVPGATCYGSAARGLFGASASHLVVDRHRVTPIGNLPAEQGILLALAATALHVLTHRLSNDVDGASGSAGADWQVQARATAPELIIGHGVLGRLLARVTMALGAPAPRVHELDASRRHGATGYPVTDPATDDETAYHRIVDVSGAGGDHLDRLIGRLAKGGDITLAGFYAEPVRFDYSMAFMREARLSIAAEWVPLDLTRVLEMVTSGALSLDGLVTHRAAIDESDATCREAYRQAFEDPDCLKMMLTWRDA